MIYLRGIRAAHAVGREIPYHAARPMAVLQNAVRIVRHVHAKVFLIKPVPFRRKLINAQRAGNKLFLYFVAHHYVQRVCQLVRLRADKAGHGLVGRAVEHFFAYALHLLGEYLLHFGIEQRNEFAAAANHVFKQAGLAFVQRHCGPAGKGRAYKLIAHVQLI